MGSLKDLKKVLYGDFVEWLETEEIDVPIGNGNMQRIKITDCFSNDVWASFILRNLMSIYSNGLNKKKELAQFVSQLPSEELQKIIKKRTEIENKAAGEKSRIIKPSGLAIPTGVRLKQVPKE